MKNKLQLVLLALAVIAAFGHGCKTKSLSKQVDGAESWAALPGILAQIKAPEFPRKDFPISDFGGSGNGTTDNTQAFRDAIAACNKSGGGRVVVPAGNYLTGPIHLKSNVNLHVAKGATVKFSTNPDDYLPLVFSRWEGVELMNYSPFIYAFEQKNIAITGEGVFDGQSNETNWWPWKGNVKDGWKPGTPNQTDKDKRAALFLMAEKNVPVAERKFGPGFYLRPQFVQPYRCENILIEGVTFINSPMWILNPVLCTNVTIQKVTVESHGPNNDGCDPESCKNVLIKDCFFNTGDDCIAIKSGRNADGRRLNIPSENIVIQGCTMANGHGGVVIGSEISGGVRDVFAENCSMNSPLLDRALRIKTSSARGGVTENIFMRNIQVGQVKEEVVIATMMYEDAGNFMPVIRNIEVRDVTVKKGGKTGVVLEAYKESPIENFRMINVIIDSVKTPYKFTNVGKVQFNNVTINGKAVDL
ncbi:glycoside hydrolase family 28 protein [Segetibacter sp. 3557_3]|uniref:glycoside hydrolase family 28 protein n=1 Tax=Segetibacter sp. 3557_3 TaxID=2547429 RepID=UPI0010586D2D|nr:glycoside hydrolase family 28 protein [Segetibacter sp. 3557_3]TDH29233.1 glycoside hydrolase family 28 protein [Segetibacter sp. 3557_3]